MNGITGLARRIPHFTHGTDRDAVRGPTAAHPAATDRANAGMNPTLAGLSEIARPIYGERSSLTHLLRAQMFARRSGDDPASKQVREIMDDAVDRLDEAYLDALNSGASPEEAAKKALEQLGEDGASFSALATNAASGRLVHSSSAATAAPASAGNALQRAAKRVRSATVGALNNAADALKERLVLQTHAV